MGLHNKTGSGSLAMTFYSPYWMINKTGQDLFYKVSTLKMEFFLFIHSFAPVNINNELSSSKFI